MSIQHIPAWKRLGLKLKHANNNIASADVNGHLTDRAHKRKLASTTVATDGSDDGRPQLKRSRIVVEPSKQELSPQVEDTPNKSSSGLIGPKRKKSVTFTADTKIEDGDSAQTIQFWTPDRPEATTTKLNGDKTQAESTPSAKGAKKEKKSKGQKGVVLLQAPKKAFAALEYLCQFHKNRSSWKFNKNHETWILKNAQSVDAIPTEDTFALALYLHGLKSEGARQRLIEQSREVLRNEPSDAVHDDTDAENQLQQLLMGSNVASDQNVEHSQFRHMSRARIVLASLGENAQQQRRGMYGNRTNLSKVKRNKSRTSRIESDPSSSSDSEETDSENSSSSTPSKTTQRAKTDTKNGVSDSSTESSDDTTDSSTDSDASTDD